jgi:hypothetical protein
MINSMITSAFEEAKKDLRREDTPRLLVRLGLNFIKNLFSMDSSISTGIIMNS